MISEVRGCPQHICLLFVGCGVSFCNLPQHGMRSNLKRSYMYAHELSIFKVRHDYLYIKVRQDRLANLVVTSARVSLADGVAEILCHSDNLVR